MGVYLSKTLGIRKGMLTAKRRAAELVPTSGRLGIAWAIHREGASATQEYPQETVLRKREFTA